jgi:hypothetical protein
LLSVVAVAVCATLLASVPLAVTVQSVRLTSDVLLSGYPLTFPPNVTGTATGKLVLNVGVVMYCS